MKEVRQRQIPYDFLYMERKKTKQTNKTKTDSRSQRIDWLVVAIEEGERCEEANSQ